MLRPTSEEIVALFHLLGAVLRVRSDLVLENALLRHQPPSWPARRASDRGSAAAIGLSGSSPVVSAAMASGMAAVGGFIAGRMSGGGGKGGSGGGSGGDGDNSVKRGGGASHAAGRATGYAFERVSSLMRGRR